MASAADGASASRVLGITQLVRARPGDRLPQLDAYRDVWNAAPTKLTDAQFSVSGTTDATVLGDQSGLATAEDIVREARVTPHRTTFDVLEVGCGAGRVGDKLAPRCQHWIGADVSQKC